MDFLNPDEVRALHKRILERSGDVPGLLQPSAIHSAVERCQWGPFPAKPTLPIRAALLLRGICMDHPFADGNKRAAFEAADTFLRRNGAPIEADADDVVSFMLDVAQGRRDVLDIASWLASHIRKG